MVTPDRIAQIQVARIGRSTDHRAANGTYSSAQSRIAGRCTNSGAARRAQ